MSNLLPITIVSASLALGVGGIVAHAAPARIGAHDTGEQIYCSTSAACHGADGSFRVVAELWYQPIGFRWAENLRLRPSAESNRFVGYYESMASSSGMVLASDSITVH